VDGEELDFLESCKVYAEETFHSLGSIRRPIILIEDEEGVIQPEQIDTSSVDDDPEERVQAVLATVEQAIRDKKPESLVVIYDAFVLNDEKQRSVRVLMLIHYSDEFENVWLAQTHGSAVGDWQEVPEGTPLCGYEGLWLRATEHMRN
jgi:hypothetical protein